MSQHPWALVARWLCPSLCCTLHQGRDLVLVPELSPCSTGAHRTCFLDEGARHDAATERPFGAVSCSATHKLTWVSCIISQGLHFLHDSPGTLETPGPGPFQPWLGGTWSGGSRHRKELRAGSMSLLCQALQEGILIARPLVIVGKWLYQGPRGEWTRAWVRRSELSPAPLLTAL